MRTLMQLTLDFFADSAAPLFLDKKEPEVSVDITQEAINNIAIKQTNEMFNESAQSLSSVMPLAGFTHPHANRQAHLGDSIVAYEFQRGKRRTIGFSVGSDGLSVRAPRWVSMAEVDKALQEKSAWILKKLDESRLRQHKMESSRIAWKDGTLVPFLGEQVIVVIDPRHAYASSADGSAQLQSDDQAATLALPGVPRLTLHIGLPHDASPERIRDAVQAWLMRQAKRIFEERLNHFAPQLKVHWTKMSLSNAGTRWGSATSDGRIRLNWRLIHLRMAVIDYVVVHELSHLRVMDHSPRFWNTVESIMPDYAALRGQLKSDLVPRW